MATPRRWRFYSADGQEMTIKWTLYKVWQRHRFIWVGSISYTTVNRGWDVRRTDMVYGLSRRMVRNRLARQIRKMRRISYRYSGSVEYGR